MSVRIFNRQRKLRVDLARLRQWTQRLEPASPIEVSIVTDRAIARIHGQFLNDPTPTDVITFEHGELIVSAETAAQIDGPSLEEELFRCIVHGMLHLQGYDDRSAADRAAMWQEQERLVTSIIYGEKACGKMTLE